MRRCGFALVGACMFVLCLPAFAQQAEAVEEKEAAIVEIGAATSWTVSGGAATFAPNLAVETTPVEHWLELELGVSPFYTRDATEWDTDLLFKKPWTLSPKAEFMLGVGPEWVHLRQRGGDDQLHCRGGRRGFYVLAGAAASVRMVSGAGVRL